MLCLASYAARASKVVPKRQQMTPHEPGRRAVGFRDTDGNDVSDILLLEIIVTRCIKF